MKNPWLSMWLSGANAWAGAARGLTAAQAKRARTTMFQEAARQQSAFVNDAARRMTELWFPDAARLAPVPVKRKRRR